MPTVHRRTVLGFMSSSLTLLAGCSGRLTDGTDAGAETDSSEADINCEDGKIPPDVDLNRLLQSAGGDWEYVGETEIEPPPREIVVDTETARIEGPPGEVIAIARRYETVADAEDAPLYGIREGPIIIGQLGTAEQTTVSVEERGSLLTSFDCVSEKEHRGRFTFDNTMIFSTSYDIKRGTSPVVSATVEATIGYPTIRVTLVRDGEEAFHKPLITEEDLTNGTATVDINLHAPEAGEYTVRYSVAELLDDEDNDNGAVLRTDTIEITDPYSNLSVESVTFEEGDQLSPFRMVVSYSGVDPLWTDVALIGPSGDRLDSAWSEENTVSLDPTGDTPRMKPGQYTLQIRIDEDRDSDRGDSKRVIHERELEYSGPNAVVQDVGITAEEGQQNDIIVSEMSVTVANTGDVPAAVTAVSCEMGTKAEEFDFQGEVLVMPDSAKIIKLSPDFTLSPGEYVLSLTLESGDETLTRSSGQVTVG